MADIRIKDLATTAASTASDDFLAVDGSANGTRKLNAYSPTFGGNLTVSGTGTSSVAGSLGVGTASPVTTLNVVKTLGSSGTIANSLLHLGSAGSLGNIYPITFGYSGSSAVNPPAFIGMEITDGNSYTKGALVFGLRDVTTDTLPTERARITSSGSLGIGTTIPNKSSFSTAVTVNGATNSGFEVAVGDTRIAGFYAASSIAVLNAFANVPLAFSTNNTTQMQLFANGNLFVGASPTDGGQKLQVSGTAAISGGIVGTTTNDSAAAGIVGELISATDNTGVSLTTGTRADVVSISLTAGDWDVTGYVGYLPSGGASSTYQEGSISATSATIGAAGARTLLKMTTTAQVEFPIPTVRVSLSGTATYYLVTNNDFTGGTMKGTGIIRARRVR